MALTLFTLMNLIIFLVSLIPYWKEKEYYTSVPLLLIGCSFLLMVINDLMEIIEPSLMNVMHVYFWTFMFAAFLTLRKKRVEYFLLYALVIIIPLSVSNVYGLLFTTTSEVIAYAIVMVYFFNLGLEEDKVMKYAGFTGVLSTALLMLNVITCETCFKYYFPTGLLAIAFTLTCLNA